MTIKVKNVCAALSALSALCAIVGAAPAAAAVTRLALQPPAAGQTFSAYSIEFSTDGERICIAGTDYDDMGVSTTRLLLIDHAHNKVAWQTTVPVPDGLDNLVPVQCLVDADRVYLLANAGTSSSPPQSRTVAYAIGFDARGRQHALKRLNPPAADRNSSAYGYAMGKTADGVTVAGYTLESDAGTERYATYTVALNATLDPVGAPVVRKNGAYTYPPHARIVGDSVYVAGRFFGATVAKEALGAFAASRVRLDGGYIWSTPTVPTELQGMQTGVADDGASYTIGYGGGKTVMVVVNRDGKATAPISYASTYCRTKALARAGKTLLAVREPCAGAGKALVAIDVDLHRERPLKSIPDEALYVAARGTLAVVLARDKGGKLFLYTATAGEL